MALLALIVIAGLSFSFPSFSRSLDHGVRGAPSLYGPRQHLSEDRYSPDRYVSCNTLELPALVTVYIPALVFVVPLKVLCVIDCFFPDTGNINGNVSIYLHLFS